MTGDNRRSHTRIMAVAAGYRSAFEQTIAAQLQDAGVEHTYEKRRIPYTPKVREYVADFSLESGMILECKGLLSMADRLKLAQVKQQHPYLDIRIVFVNSRAKINRASRITYAAWATRMGFPFADGCIPAEWLAEATGPGTPAGEREGPGSSVGSTPPGDSTELQGLEVG